MPFLTQGKTNWKYILIVVILAMIVGGGILGYWRWVMKEEWEKEGVEILGLDRYLHKDAVLYGVDMPPEAGYQAISTKEAILIVAQNLENQNIKDIKIRHLLWSVAPRGEFFIAGDCSFTQEGEQYNKFLAVIKDGSEGEVGKPSLIFKDTDIWYSNLAPPDLSEELVGRHESLANIYNVTPIFKSSEIKDQTEKCSPVDFAGYELVKNYKFNIDLNNDGEKEIVQVYWDSREIKVKPIMVKVFSGTENCPKEVFSFGWGNLVGKVKIFQNFWGNRSDVVLVEGMSYAGGCGSSIRLLFLTYREGRYSIVEGPQLGGLHRVYKFDGDDGVGKKIIVAEERWATDFSDYCCGCTHRLQFMIYTWDGEAYTKTVAGITQNRYRSGSIDEILQKEPSVLNQQ